VDDSEDRLSIEQIKSTISIPRVLEELGIELSRDNRTPCWHDGLDAHTTLSVQVDDTFFYCHRCGKGGSVIDVVMELGSVNFDRAMWKLNQMIRRGDLDIGTIAVAERQEKELLDFSKDYMTDVVSVAWTDWEIPGVNLDLVDCRVKDREGRYAELLIPHHNNGKAVGVKVRHRDGRKDAWPGSVFTSKLFEADYTHRAGGRTIVCEGETDAWAMHQHLNGGGYCKGESKVFALPSGASTWKDHWQAELSPFSEVYLCFDNDDAGHKARQKVGAALKWQAKDLMVPQLYNDAREAIVAGWKPTLIDVAW